MVLKFRSRPDLEIAFLIPPSGLHSALHSLTQRHSNPPTDGRCLEQRPTARHRAWALVLLGSLLALAVRGADLTYAEPLRVEWGEVSFRTGETDDAEQTWFARTSPTFAAGTHFSLAERLCLSNAFLSATGRVAGQLVWRINRGTLIRFRQLAQGAPCLPGAEFTGADPAPDDWESGPKTVDWEFAFDYTLPGVELAPPTLELALLTDDVPTGVAWEVPIPAALDDPDLVARAELTPDALASVRTAASWARVFLVAPGTFAKGVFHETADFPSVRTVPDLRAESMPAAFGLRALAEIAAVFGADRSFRSSAFEQLRRRLSPDQPEAFPGAARWFPEADSSRRALEVTWVQTGISPDQLVQIANPSAGVFETPRVLSETNEWAVRVGPFRRMQPPLARIGQVQGATQTHDVAALPTLLSNRPSLLQRYERDLRDLDAKMQAKITGSAPAAEGYFWLPEWTQAAALTARERSVRSLERVRYVRGVTVAFVTNRFVYEGVYAPAEIHGQVGASYNSTHGAGLEVEGGWDGLVRAGDSLSVKGTVAERLLSGELSYALPYHRSLDRRTTLQLELFGEAGRDDEFRLGSLSPSPFRHEHEAGGLAHRMHHSADAWTWEERDEVLWDAHELSPTDWPGAGADAGLLLHHQQTWRWTPAEGSNAPARWDYWIAPALDIAPPVGWKDAFVRGEFGAGVRASFGGSSRDGMYVSLRGAYGCASAELPPVLEFRLGDARRLYGLEPGEYSGRSFVHGELAYGLNLSPLLGGLFRGTNGVSQPPPFLEGLYLQALAEIGTFSPQGGLHALAEPERVLSSFGAALEKTAPALGAGAGFRIGYAWSPDSLRRHGRLFTALSWSF